MKIDEKKRTSSDLPARASQEAGEFTIWVKYMML
jgi:hypothetical protein